MLVFDCGSSYTYANKSGITIPQPASLFTKYISFKNVAHLKCAVSSRRMRSRSLHGQAHFALPLRTYVTLGPAFSTRISQAKCKAKFLCVFTMEMCIYLVAWRVPTEETFNQSSCLCIHTKNVMPRRFATNDPFAGIHPQRDNLDSCLSTFDNWPIQTQQKHLKLAAARSCYFGGGDEIVSYFRGGTLLNCSHMIYPLRKMFSFFNMRLCVRQKRRNNSFRC